MRRVILQQRKELASLNDQAWGRTDRHGLFGLSRTLEIIAQSKTTLVKIIGLGVGIAWNLVDWCEMAFWAIIMILPRGTPWKWRFTHLGSENCVFAVYCNFFSLIIFCSKVRIKSRLFYDFALKSILPFLVNFSFLSPNCVIMWIRVLDVFLSIYMFCSRQRQDRLLLIKFQSFLKLLSGRF